MNFSNLNITKGSSGCGYVGYYASLVLNNPEFIDNYVFAPNGNTYALYGYMGTDTNLQLPEKYKGENYIIGDYAFYDCSSLRRVFNFSKLNISKGSSGYGYVGYYAYLVLNNPEIIDNYVFAPKGGTYALYGYMGTDTNLQLPEKYKGENYVIGDYAFSSCSALTSVTIGNSVTSIED